MLPISILGFFRIQNFTPIYFDGSFFLFFSTINGSYANSNNLGRIIGHIFYETPNIIYSRIFAPLFKTSALIYSASVVLLPILFLIVCYFILPKNKKYLFSFPVFGYSTTAITSLYFEISEINLATSFLWLIGCILVRKTSKIRLKQLLIFLLMVLLSFTYPLILMCGPGIIIFKFRENNWKLKDASGVIYTALFIMLNFILLIDHNNHYPSTTANFIQSITTFLTNPSAKAGLLLTATAFVLNYFIKYGAIFYIICGTIIFLDFTISQPFIHSHLYDGRSAGVLITILLFYYFVLIPTHDKKRHYWILVSFFTLITAMSFSAIYLREWKNLKNEVVFQSQRHRGVISWEDFTKKTKIFEHACTEWNSEMFSILIQHLEGQDVRLIVNRHPESPKSFFDWLGEKRFLHTLSRLGIKVDHAGFISK